MLEMCGQLDGRNARCGIASAPNRFLTEAVVREIIASGIYQEGSTVRSGARKTHKDTTDN
jgi:hypothetical protein